MWCEVSTPTLISTAILNVIWHPSLTASTLGLPDMLKAFYYIYILISA